MTLFFATDLLRQTVRNLWHDDALMRWSTWRSAGTFLFGRGGLVRRTWQPWRAYFHADFHPANQGGESGVQWLLANAAQVVAVGASGCSRRARPRWAGDALRYRRR